MDKSYTEAKQSKISKELEQIYNMLEEPQEKSDICMLFHLSKGTSAIRLAVLEEQGQIVSFRQGHKTLYVQKDRIPMGNKSKCAHIQFNVTIKELNRIDTLRGDQSYYDFFVSQHPAINPQTV